MASRNPSVHAISLQTIHRVHMQKQPSTYAPLLPKAARDQLITAYAKLHGRSVHNGATLNLTNVRVQSGTLSLTASALDFFDLLMFTVFREPQQAVATQLTQHGYSRSGQNLHEPTSPLPRANQSYSILVTTCAHARTANTTCGERCCAHRR